MKKFEIFITAYEDIFSNYYGVKTIRNIKPS